MELVWIGPFCIESDRVTTMSMLQDQERNLAAFGAFSTSSENLAFEDFSIVRQKLNIITNMLAHYARPLENKVF